tara:strand:+ start:971 stop:1288 length:318 start_codon:yes stop_codon:yes gene_type:complete
MLISLLSVKEQRQGSEVMAKPHGLYRGQILMLKPQTEAGAVWTLKAGWQWYTAFGVSNASQTSRDFEGYLGELLRGDSRAGQVYYLYSLIQLLFSRPCCTAALSA